MRCGNRLRSTSDPRLFAVVLLGLLANASCSAEQRVEPRAAEPADESQAIAVTDVAVLRQKVGETVTVRGRVSRTGKSSSGINFLNFAGTELTVVCFKENAAKFDAAPADLFDGKDVEVTGTLERFKGKLQVPLDGPDAIRIVKVAAPDRGPPAKPYELREVGKDHWLSPAGLNYRGRDPDGRTRLAHVLRHAEDQPRRDGPHGVFDGGRDGALATVDEAWRLAKRKRLRPRIDGGRAAYTVRLDRKVGWLGGSVGKRRNHPELRSVLIVLEQGTTNVVTAYPK